MDIKILCDRCFEDAIEGRSFYKYGSAVYCEKCHTEIEDELRKEMIADTYRKMIKKTESESVRRFA